MGERKGLTKYYPPDFDPSKLTRIKRPRDREISSHFMLPMSVRCLTCGEFMGAGLKFNAKKSTADETYLGTKIFRFSMKCKACPATFIIKTDPQHQDYICEAGAKRNFQAWRADKEAEEEAKAVREEQDLDAMQALENKTLEAKQEMEDLDALDELRTRKSMAAKISTEMLLERHRDAHDISRGAHGAPSDADLEQQARIAFLRKSTAIKRVSDMASEAEGDLSLFGASGGKRRQDVQSSRGGTEDALVRTRMEEEQPLKRSAGIVVVRKKRRKPVGDVDTPKRARRNPVALTPSSQSDDEVVEDLPPPALEEASGSRPPPGLVGYAVSDADSSGSTSESSGGNG